MGDPSQTSASEVFRSQEPSDFHDFTQNELDQALALVQKVRRAEARSFSLEKAVDRLTKKGITVSGSYVYWEYTHWYEGWFQKPGVLSKEEAQFYFFAATHEARLVSANVGDSWAKDLRNFVYEPDLAQDTIKERLEKFIAAASSAGWSVTQMPFMGFLLRELLGKKGACEILLGSPNTISTYLTAQWLDGLGPWVDDEQGEAERAQFIEWASKSVDPAKFAANNNDRISAILIRSGHQPHIRAAVELWSSSATSYYTSQVMLDLIYALEDNNEYLSYLKKVGQHLPIKDVLRLIHRTGYQYMGWAVQYSLRHGAKSEKKTAMDAYLKVHSATLVSTMFEITLLPGTSKDALLIDGANRWLLNEGANAISGLLPVAASKTKVRDAARGILRKIIEKGGQQLVQEGIARLPEKMQQNLGDLIPQVESVEHASLDGWPDWVPNGVDTSKLPAWALSDSAPRIKDLEGRPVPRQVPLVILQRLAGLGGSGPAFSQSTIATLRDGGEKPLSALLNRLDPSTADEWASYILEAYFRSESTRAYAWLPDLLALFPSFYVIDRCTPYLHKNKRFYVNAAKRAITALSAVGSNDAVWALLGMNEVGNLAGAATTALNDLCSGRKLSQDELIESTTPNCGLDERGTAQFDYGSRKFTLALKGIGETQITDQAGHVFKNLPPPKTEDSIDLVNKARQRYKEITTRLKEVFAHQLATMDRFLVARRVWNGAFWKANILGHVVNRQFARCAVWGLLDSSSTIQVFFRASDDFELVDLNESVVSIPDDAQIILAHPIDLTAEQRAAWIEQFADYKIVQPLDQLARQLSTDNPDRTAEVFKGGVFLVYNALWSNLAKSGWTYCWNTPRSLRKNMISDGKSYDVDIEYEQKADSSGMWKDYVVRVQFYQYQGPFGTAINANDRVRDALSWTDVPVRISSEIFRELAHLYDSIGTG